MIDLKKITRGRQKREPRVMVYGPSAIGKTTFAAGAPNPFVIDADKGSHKLDVQRVVPENWDEARDWMTAVEKDEVKCDSLILDSVTELEAMSYAALFGGEAIDSWNKGYGRGDTRAIQEWREVLAQLERIWMKGKAIVVVAHTVVKRFEDPLLPSGYDRFEIAARKQLAQLLTQWMDYTLFCREDVTPLGKDAKNKAVTTGVRYAHTRRCPSFDAKARGTTQFPDRISLSWAEFDAAIKNDSGRIESLTREIDTMLAKIGDKALDKEVRSYIKDYPSGLSEAHNRLVAILEEREKPATTTEESKS
jgi:AAA domain